MTVLERSIVIEAMPDAIQAVALDASRLPEWYVGIEQTEPDGVYPEVGGTVAAVYKAAGLSFNIKMISIELVPGERQAMRMEGMITGTSRWTFAAEGGGTRITANFDYEMPGGGVGKVLDKLVVERMNTENLEKSLQKLKAVVEGGGPA
jgi:hypothetical protein